jgi:hypothetical protein
MSVENYLNIAKELSLSRHSLNDDLSELTRELLSLGYNEEHEPMLLEDLETLHRNLTELQSVKQYVQVIEHTLLLRWVISTILSNSSDLYMY